jgi:Peroxidase
MSQNAQRYPAECKDISRGHLLLNTTTMRFAAILLAFINFSTVCQGFRRGQSTGWTRGTALFAGKQKIHQPISSREQIVQPLTTLGKSALSVTVLPLLLNPTFNAVPPAFAENDFPDWKKVRADITELVKNKPDKGPTLVRLAWHSSGTYDKMRKDGGSQKGTIRFTEELKHGANAGLDLAVSWLEPIKKKYDREGANLSYADLYTLAGVEAIKTMGGPTIPWRAGRVDSLDESDVTPDGRLPDADKGSPAKVRGTIHIYM